MNSIRDFINFHSGDLKDPCTCECYSCLVPQKTSYWAIPHYFTLQAVHNNKNLLYSHMVLPLFQGNYTKGNKQPSASWLVQQVSNLASWYFTSKEWQCERNKIDNTRSSVYVPCLLLDLIYSVVSLSHVQLSSWNGGQLMLRSADKKL